MANTAVGITKKQSSQLPVPNLKLVHRNLQTGQDPVFITILDNSWNVSDKYELYRFPQIVATDLTQEQIDKGVYVEMVHYVRGMSRYNLKKGAGYVVPSPWIGGANPLGNKWTRGGGHYSTGGTALPDRPNHYQMTAQNQVVNVHEYLHNRHMFVTTPYYDQTGTQQSIKLLSQVARVRTQSWYPGKSFMYSSRYTPYYFAFRYVMWDESTNQFISGPLTKTIKLTHQQHPFIVDAQQSAILGRQVGNVSALFNDHRMQCMFETRLP